MLGLILMTLAFVTTSFVFNSALMASILFLGITAAMVSPIVSALPAQILGPRLVSIGFGITATCLNVGAALAQPFIGYVRDVTNAYAPCVLTMATLSAIGAFFAYTLKPS